MREAYKETKFRDESLSVIALANGIIDEYQAAGYTLTLRQLYYQFVARGYLPNSQSEYKRLGGLINAARLAGLVDWEGIEDRTRSLAEKTHWTDANEIIEAAARSFRIDRWARQPIRPEVWVEKEALVGVIERACREHDIGYFACRGYTSQSAQWRAGKRFLDRYERFDQKTLILHFGDHDPSGIDMTRDNRDRLEMFTDYGDFLEVRRLALNMDQVEQYNPPPNPAKLTDSRVGGYLAQHGDQSWELDALEPSVISGLIEAEVVDVRDPGLWEEAVDEENERRRLLKLAAANWADVAAYIDNNFDS